MVLATCFDGDLLGQMPVLGELRKTSTLTLLALYSKTLLRQKLLLVKAMETLDSELLLVTLKLLVVLVLLFHSLTLPEVAGSL